MKTFCVSTLFIFATSYANAQVYRIGPRVLHHSVSFSPLPQFPQESVAANHQGRVVVDVQVGESGSVGSADIVETPDARIGAAAISAVKKWKFHPFEVAGTPVKVQSRLVFYFTIDAGVAKVIDATGDASAKTNP